MGGKWRGGEGRMVRGGKKQGKKASQQALRHSKLARMENRAALYPQNKQTQNNTTTSKSINIQQASSQHTKQTTHMRCWRRPASRWSCPGSPTRARRPPGSARSGPASPRPAPARGLHGGESKEKEELKRLYEELYEVLMLYGKVINQNENMMREFYKLRR